MIGCTCYILSLVEDTVALETLNEHTDSGVVAAAALTCILGCWLLDSLQEGLGVLVMGTEIGLRSLRQIVMQDCSFVM